MYSVVKTLTGYDIVKTTTGEVRSTHKTLHRSQKEVEALTIMAIINRKPCKFSPQF